MIYFNLSGASHSQHHRFELHDCAKSICASSAQITDTVMGEVRHGQEVERHK